MSGALDGHVVVVTGAGGGIGRGVALACAARGASVVIASRGENGSDVATEICDRGEEASWIQTDVTQDADVRAAVDHAVDRYGALHAVIHNATSGSSSQPQRIEDLDRAAMDDHLAVSLTGAHHCARHSFDHLRRTKGAMLVMTSPAGIEGSATLPMYATMKGALRGFAKSLAREWGPHQITVNALSPLGFSPAMERAIEADPGMKTRLAGRVPMVRVGDTETDVGAAVAFFVGPDSRYVTGQTVGVDGGHFMSL